jgi:hypothetical protein
MNGKVWEFKDMRFSYHATGVAGSIEFKTDMPGAAMAVRKTIALPVTTERVTSSSPLDAIEGRQFQPKFIPGASTGILRVFEATVLARPIGVYLEASKSDFYETQPITLGA